MTTKDPSRPDSRGALAAAATLSLLAVLLRLPNLGWGLPEIEEEALPLKKAFEMWGWSEGGVRFDPETAGWPSLSFYLHLAAQHLHYFLGRVAGVFADRYDYFLLQLDMTPVVLVGRWLGVLAAGVITWTGARLGAQLAGTAGALLAGAALAVSPLLVENSQLITPDILLAAFGALAVARIVAIERRGHWRDYVLAGVWIGLGASCKYTPVLLAAVLYWAHLAGRRGVGASLRRGGFDDRRLWLAALGAAFAFAATSPFVVANIDVFRRDLSYQALHLGGGHIGQATGPAWIYYLKDVLAPSFGWPAMVVSVGGLGWAAWRRRGGWLVLVLCLLVFWGVLGALTTRFDRYMLPVLVPLALGPVGLWLCLREELKGFTAARRRIVWTVLVVLCLVQPAFGTFAYHRERALESTLARAKNFFLERRADDLVVAMEPYCPELPRQTRQQLSADPVFDRLSPSQRERWLDQPFFNVVYMPFLVSRVELCAFYYDLRHLAACDYVVTSSAVRGRYEREPRRFPRQVAFYRDLDRFAVAEAVFEPGESARGPEIRVYRLDADARSALLAERGRLDADFWRPFLDDLHGPHFRGFCSQVARFAVLREDFETADLFASALLEVVPAGERIEVLPLAALARLRLGDWSVARDRYREVVATRPGDARSIAYLGYALMKLGETEEARSLFERCVATGDARSAAWASRQLADLDADPDPTAPR